jgi:hypothetical protein
MSNLPGAGEPVPREKGVPWSRIGEFLKNVLRIERSVEGLRNENKFLRERLETMQRQLDQQTGQLLVLSEFVTKALDDRVAAKADEAAVRAVDRIMQLLEKR